jgi:hypothetical protein
VDAKLNPLALLGGLTRVHLPKLDSPVINMIVGSDYPSTDQRSVTRPQDVGADAGSVERQSSDPPYSLLVYLLVVIR